MRSSFPAAGTEQEPEAHRANELGFSESDTEWAPEETQNISAAKPLFQSVGDNAFHRCARKSGFNVVTKSLAV
jgi:hypothetical protein